MKANNFFLIRVALASLVVWSHSFELLERSPSGGYHSGINLGVLAVDGFFLLSGFLITQSWNREPRLLSFLAKRVRRIYPGFLVAIGLSLLVFGPLGASDRAAYWAALKPGPALLSAATLTSPKTAAVFPAVHPPLVNGSLWTIRYEFGCYLLVAALGVTGLLARRGLVATLAGLAWAAYAWEQWHGPWAWGGRLDALVIPLPRLVTFYLVGCCFAVYTPRVSWRPVRVLAALALLVVAYRTSSALGNAVLPFLSGYLLFAAAFAPTGSLGPMANAGPDWSYGLYLYAWPVQMLLIQCFPAIHPLAVVAGTMLGAGGLGLLSWYGIERPATRGRKAHFESQIGAERIAVSSARFS